MTDTEPRVGVPVGDLLQAPAAPLRLELRAGAAGLDKLIEHPRVQKAALAVSGHVESIRAGRVQVLGAGEISYLAGRPARRRALVFRRICTATPVTCFIVTGGRQPPAELTAEAEEHGVPVLVTPLVSWLLIDQLQRLLDDRLAPRTSVHGDLLDVYGVGMLLLGQSGIGKSECALDLVARGHRLVADDVVDIRRESDILIGTGPELSKYHMEIRGIGLINIRELFGISAIRSTKFIELVVLLEPWTVGKQYDRLGLDDAHYAILGIDLPLVRMPVAPGRNLAILVEVATRNHLAKMKGQHAARAFVERVAREMERKSGEGGAGRLAAGRSAGKAPSPAGPDDDADEVDDDGEDGDVETQETGPVAEAPEGKR